MTHHKTSDIPFHNSKLWNWHDIYLKSVSYSRVITRSQTAFNRIVITDEEFDLFSDPERHEPPNLPHLMFTMKDGIYGAIPRTIITRSTAQLLKVSPVLSKTIEAYKTFYPMIHAGVLTHGRDDLVRQVPDKKVFQPTGNQLGEPMEEDQPEQLPPILPEIHAHRIAHTPPEVLRDSSASMKFRHDDERLTPESEIVSTVTVSNSSKAEYQPKSPIVLHESPESDQESIEKHLNFFGSDQKPFRTDQEHLESDQKLFKPDQERLESDEKTSKTAQENIESNKKHFKPDRKSLKTYQEFLETDQESLETDQDSLETDQDSLQTGEESLKKDQESLEKDQESLEKDQESLKKDQESLKTDQESLKTDQESLKSGQEPLKSGQEPLETDQELLETDQEPLEIDQEPLDNDKEPLANNQKPMEIVQEPLETDETHEESMELEPTTSATDSSIDEAVESSSSHHKKARDPVRFLHDLLDNMSARPNDDHLYKDDKNESDEEDEDNK